MQSWVVNARKRGASEADIINDLKTQAILCTELADFSARIVTGRLKEFLDKLDVKALGA